VIRALKGDRAPKYIEKNRKERRRVLQKRSCTGGAVDLEEHLVVVIVCDLDV
jgi:hypothetical protein